MFGERIDGEKAAGEKDIFGERLAVHYDELKWLYMELYNDEVRFAELCANLRGIYNARKETLKALDDKREADPQWYRGSGLLGMMMYVGQFAGNLKGVAEHLPVLLVSGKDDAVGDMGEGVKKLARYYRDKIKMKDVELVLFDGSRHEFLNEWEEKENKWAVPLEFFDKICAEKA